MLLIKEVKPNKGSPHGIVAKVLDSSLEITKFKLQSHYNIHFQTNILRKGVNPLIPPAIG